MKKLPSPAPQASEHRIEIWLLGMIALGVMVLAAISIAKSEAAEASAWTAVLMAIINAIKERWQQRSLDRMGQSLANAPPAQPPAGTQPRQP